LLAVASARAVVMALNGDDLHCHVVPALELPPPTPSPSTTRMDSSPSTSTLLTATTTSKSVRQSLLLALRDNSPRRNAHVTRLGRHSIHERYRVRINPHRPDACGDLQPRRTTAFRFVFPQQPHPNGIKIWVQQFAAARCKLPRWESIAL
jgi:hypothetical protein